MSGGSDQSKDRFVAATIGMFDGVHRGHQRLIGQTREQASAAELLSVVITLDRHPFVTLRPEAAPRLLTGLEHKVELLYLTGVDDVVVLAFDTARAAQSAEDFVSHYLVEQLGVRLVVVGEGFRFGNRQKGDVALLQQTGTELGFGVATVPLLVEDGPDSIISSSKIRELIELGDLDQAAAMLGRPHEVRGRLADSGELVVSAELVTPPAGEYELIVSTAGKSASARGLLTAAGEAEGATIKLSGVSDELRLVAGSRAAVQFVLSGLPAGRADRIDPTGASQPDR